MSYLNYNSTNAPMTHKLNISDIAYNSVLETRMTINDFILAVKRFINAPINAEVIINSGATESIANSIIWGKINHPNGAIYGTEFDHDSVKINAENYKVQYKILGKEIPHDASVIMLTHVSGKTGEIFDINGFMRKFNSHAYLSDRDTTNEDTLQASVDPIGVRQNRPLVIVDATQSINKLKIDMERLKIDGLFFSLHKIGGPQGFGVFVIKPNIKMPFVPLVGGNQQKKLRGGTLDLAQVATLQPLLKVKPLNTKKKWEDSVNYLLKNGIEVIKPKGNHLYNTILIHINTCPLGIINRLSTKYNIFVGAVSACALENEQIVKSNDGFIRLSFNEPNQINNNILDKIIKTIQKNEEIEEEMNGGFFREDTDTISNITESSSDDDNTKESVDKTQENNIEELLNTHEEEDEDEDEEVIKESYLEFL